MAKYEKFEDLPVWQEAKRLYRTGLDLPETPRCPLTPGFRNQLERVTTPEVAEFSRHRSRLGKRGALNDGRRGQSADHETSGPRPGAHPGAGGVMRETAHGVGQPEPSWRKFATC